MHSFIANAVTVAHKGGSRAVRQFDLEFNGDVLAVVGKEADGKTSLINALAGLVNYEGEFILDGVPLSRKPSGDRVEAILEDYCLIGGKTVRENLAYPLKIRKIPYEEIVAAVDNSIIEYGLQHYADVKAKKLAENIKPYVAVARLALIPRELYLFDDILKVVNKEDKVYFLKKLMLLFEKFDGMKIYATSHIGEARALADKIVVIYGGVIEQYGTFDEIANNPLSVRVAEIVDPNVKFSMTILREIDNKLSARIKGIEVNLEEGSGDRLLSRSYIGREVQVAEYHVDDTVSYLLMDAETDKTIFKRHYRGL